MPLNFLNNGYFAGTVGIGTNSPGAKLEIKDGNLWLNGATSNYNPEIFFIDDAGPTGIAGAKIRYENNNGNLYFDHKWDTATSGFFFRNRVDGTALNTMSLVNGKVGIDIDTPQAPLSFANVAGNKIDFYYNTTTNDRYGIQVQASELRIHSGAAGQSTGGITFGKDNGTTFTEAMRIRNDGKVGIGTASPLGKLQVNEYTVASQGNQNVHGELSVFTNSGDESLFLGIKNAAYPNRGWAFNPVTSGVNSDLQIKEHGASGVRMVIESGGNVGIGVTNPTEKLHLQSTTSGCFVRFADNTASGVYVGSRNDELEIYAGNAERMGIDATGVVRFNAYGTGILQTDTNGVISVNLSPLVDGIIFNNGASITNQINTDVDTGTETVASVAIATYTAAFFDFVIKKTTNVRSGTVYACHDGTNVEFTETSTQDLGDTSDVTLSVDISGGNMRLRATTISDDWSVKSLIRAI